MTKKPSAATLLSFVRGAETSRGYDDYYRGSVLVPSKKVSEMTVGEVRAWQKESVRRGSKSSAVGGYQFISSTFDNTVKALGIPDTTVFSPEVQDAMGLQLLKGRGYDQWAGGGMSDDQFIDNLAQEWAAIPRATGPKRGASHYAGDGLNGATRGLPSVYDALTQSRNGVDVDLSGHGAGTAAPYPSGPRFELEGDANSSFTGADMSLFRTPAPDFLDDRSLYQMRKAQAEGEKTGFWDAMWAAADDEWVANNVARNFGVKRYEPDPNFSWNAETQKRFMDGLSEPYQVYFEDAMNEEHAQLLRERALQAQATDNKLAEWGWGGIAMRFGAALADPVALGVSALTGGLAAPVIAGGKVMRVATAIKAGASAAAVNMGLEGAIIASDPMREWDGLVYAAAAGFVIGGATGAFKQGIPEDGQLEAPMREIMKIMDAGDSIGAARSFQNYSMPNASEVLGRQLENAPRTAKPLGPRIDMVGYLKSSENPVTRHLGGLLAEDAVGNADGSVNRISASELMARENRVRLNRFYRDADPAFREWRKANGKWALSVTARQEFFDLVGKAVRRPLDAAGDAHVNKVASRLKTELADLLQFAKDKGLRGFDEVEENSEYLTRQHNIKRLDDLFERYGEASVTELYARSMVSSSRRTANRKKAYEALDISDAVPLARAYIRSVRSQKFNAYETNTALNGAQEDVLREMLEDVGTEADVVDRILDRLRSTNATEDTGKIGSAMRRAGLDETFRLRVQNPRSHEWEEIGIEDALENNAEHLFTNYTRQVTGAGFLEEALRDLRVPEADGSMPSHAPSWATVRNRVIENSKGDPSEDLKRLDILYKYLRGVPLNETGKGAELMRLARDYNFTRVMGQVGVAQISEIGNILGHGGIRATLQQLPALRRIFANAKTGKFSDGLLEEIEAIWGFGTDFSRSSPGIHLDDYGAAETLGSNKPWARQANFLLQNAKQATSVSSGMAHINMALQRMSARVLIQRMVNEASGGSKLSKSRMRALGLSDEMHDRVREQLRKHVATTDGALGRKVKSVNFEAWDDMQARAAFTNSVDRWANKVIQVNDIGNMPVFMTKELGKTLFQFRSFMVAAHTKQLASGIHHRDWMTFSSWMMGMTFGGLAYVGQTYVNSVGQPNQQQWLEDRLSTASIGKAAFQRAGFSTFVPAAVDTVGGMFMDEPVFAFRNTELASGLLSGSPTVDLAVNLQRGVAGSVKAATRDDYQFSQQDMRALKITMAFQNAFVIRNGLSMLGGTLPAYSQ